MFFFAQAVKKGNYHIEILEPDTEWKHNPKECHKYVSAARYRFL